MVSLSKEHLFITTQNLFLIAKNDVTGARLFGGVYGPLPGCVDPHRVVYR